MALLRIEVLFLPWTALLIYGVALIATGLTLWLRRRRAMEMIALADERRAKASTLPVLAGACIVTEADRQQWLAKLVQEHGEQWVKENQALLDAKWEYLRSM